MNDESKVMSPTDARVTLGGIRPLKEGDEGARGSCLITKVQVIAAGIVEIHSFFDEAQAQDLCVKIHGPLGISTDNGDVMNTLDSHSSPPFTQIVTSRSMIIADANTIMTQWIRKSCSFSPHTVARQGSYRGNLA